MGKNVNQRELAEFCDVSDVTIWEWQREGLPIASQGARGEANVYDCAAVIEFLIQRALARAGTAKARIELELLEIDLRKKKSEESLREGRLVPADRVRPIWESRVLAAAAFMIGRASRLAGVIEATPGFEAKRAELRRSDHEFLSLLGVHGEQLQSALEAFLATATPESVKALFGAMDAVVSTGTQGP
jgi:hypothetical protein